MWEFWVFVALLALFLWRAGRHLRNRTSGPSVRDDRDRRTGGHHGGGGGVG